MDKCKWKKFQKNDARLQICDANLVAPFTEFEHLCSDIHGYICHKITHCFSEWFFTVPALPRNSKPKSFLRFMWNHFKSKCSYNENDEKIICYSAQYTRLDDE